MSPVRLILAAALTLSLSATAATGSKKASKDPAFAATWSADAKTMSGKKVTTCVLTVGEVGAVSGDAAYAIVPVTTGNTRGEEGGEILAVIPAKDLTDFIAKATKVTQGKISKFGSKVTYTPTTGTLATFDGELTFVVGPVPTKLAKKPSELLADQQAAASASTDSAGTAAAPAEKQAEEKPAPETKPKKKVAR